MANDNRQPKGIPVGGQFATGAKPESEDLRVVEERQLAAWALSEGLANNAKQAEELIGSALMAGTGGDTEEAKRVAYHIYARRDGRGVMAVRLGQVETARRELAKASFECTVHHILGVIPRVKAITMTRILRKEWTVTEESGRTQMFDWQGEADAPDRYALEFPDAIATYCVGNPKAGEMPVSMKRNDEGAVVYLEVDLNHFRAPDQARFDYSQQEAAQRQAYLGQRKAMGWD